MCQTRNYSEIYSCVCANGLSNKMKLNIEESVTIFIELKFKTKKCLLMTPATFELKKINANIDIHIYIYIYIYRCIQTRELGKSGKPVWKNLNGDLYVCIYIYICVCIYIYIYISLSLYIYIYLYIYTKC